MHILDFANAKEKNINQFLQLLEEEANDYLAKLNRNDFHGIIRIIKTYNNSARIELHSENGLRIKNPNGALKQLCICLFFLLFLVLLL